MTRPSADVPIEHLLRELTPQVLGTVVRRFRDFAAAEDAVQEALPIHWQWAELRVIDKTGLDGFYDFTLAFIPPEGLYGLPPGVEKPDYPDIFHAVKEQLGLKLESQKGQRAKIPT